MAQLVADHQKFDDTRGFCTNRRSTANVQQTKTARATKHGLSQSAQHEPSSTRVPVRGCTGTVRITTKPVHLMLMRPDLLCVLRLVAAVRLPNGLPFERGQHDNLDYFAMLLAWRSSYCVRKSRPILVDKDYLNWDRA